MNRSRKKWIAFSCSASVAIACVYGCALTDLDETTAGGGDAGVDAAGDVLVQDAVADSGADTSVDSGPFAIAVSVGEDHACALFGDGTVRCWGANFAGELGNGKTSDGGAQLATQVIDLTGPVAALAGGGGDHNASQCAVLVGKGTVECWGGNAMGQLADGTTMGRAVPGFMVGLDGGAFSPKITEVSLGAFHGCAAFGDDVVPTCWGNNAAGQLGAGFLGDAGLYVSPIGTGALSIGAGSAHSCAVSITGEIQCWGYNQYGQLGDGTKTMRPTAQAIVAGDGGFSGAATSVVAHDTHSCARLASSEVWCWGENSAGELGNGGGGAPITTPVQVRMGASPLTDVKKISGGACQHTCAVLNNGKIVCWGLNADLQIGNGDVSRSPVFEAEEAILPSNAVDVATGGDSTSLHGTSCAALDDGSVWCWGYNGHGQLGDGTTIGNGPVQVKF